MPPSAADLRTKAVALREASAEISSGISSTSSIHSQLGDQVAVHGKKRGLKKGQSARDIFQSWDKNGNAHLSKMEFRVAARKLHLDAATDSSTVDSLFAELDKDGDGNLNTSDSEFKEALEMLKDESAAAEAEREDAKAEALRLLDVANQCIKTAGALEAVDAAKAEMTRLEQLVGASVQRRVGMALLGMGFRAVDIALKWDSNKDGRVDKDEVMAGLKALNVSVSDKELRWLHAHARGAFPPLSFSCTATFTLNHRRVMKTSSVFLTRWTGMAMVRSTRRRQRRPFEHSTSTRRRTRPDDLSSRWSSTRSVRLLKQSGRRYTRWRWLQARRPE